MNPNDRLANALAEALASGAGEEAGEPEAEEFTYEPQVVPFLDLPIDVSVQLDRKRVKIGEVLNYQRGSIISVKRSAGENVDLLLDGRRVGSGEIVVIEDLMGLRVTELGLQDPAKKKEHRSG